MSAAANVGKVARERGSMTVIGAGNGLCLKDKGLSSIAGSPLCHLGRQTR